MLGVMDRTERIHLKQQDMIILQFRQKSMNFAVRNLLMLLQKRSSRANGEMVLQENRHLKRQDITMMRYKRRSMNFLDDGVHCFPLETG